ncbi:MAG TPA: hypothetical protein VGC06_12965 [Actinomycetes bacterium]
MRLASTPLPPNVHAVYELLCAEGPQTGGALEALLARQGVVVPADRLLELPRRFPGSFTLDQAGRLLVPPACDRCGAQDCEACQRDVGARPCPVCERTVCRQCRGDGPGLRALCADCAVPRRVPEADLRYCRAWALGGGRQLLVGERSAMLFGGSGGGRVLVPDADLDDPGRQRLRALAAALQVPPEIGLRWAGPAAPAPRPGRFTAGLRVRQVPAWDWLPAGGSQVDQEATDALPWAEGPPVEGESAAGLTVLLARLRAEAPPPPAGALVVTPLLEVRHTTVTADGLERRVERHHPGGEVEALGAEHAPFEPSRHETAAPARPVACAQLGEVLATLDAVHASFRVATRAPDGERSWFVPAAPGLTLGSEHTWAAVVQASGLAEGTQARRAKALESWHDAEFATPSQAVLVDRRTEEAWRMVRGVPDAGVAGAEELAMVGYELAGVAQPPDGPAGLLETARRLDPLAGAGQVTLSVCLQVTEHWKAPGAGPEHPGVRRTYLVTPGRKPWPKLDDSGERAADFGVDDLGHLHGPGASWRCPACRRACCRACGPDGELADCPGCGQPACRECRLKPAAPVADERCQRCGLRSCGTCGRTLAAQACRLCRRVACDACLQPDGDGRCATCLALHRATPAEIARLDRRLAATGLEVLLAVDGTWTVAVLLGRRRRELAVLRAGELVRWETAQPDAPVMLRARIGAARLAGADVDVRQGRVVEVTPPPEPHLLLNSTSRDSLRWAVLDRHGRTVAGSEEPAAPQGTDASTSVLARLVEEAGWGTVAIPQPADDDLAELLRELPAGAAGRDAGGTLLLDPRAAAETTWLDREGLHHAAFDGVQARQVDAAWTPGSEPPWVADDWFPAPEVVLAASLEGVGAALVRVGAHVALGLRDGEGTRWATLRDRPAELAKLALATVLDEEGALFEVVALSDPDTVRGPILVDGSMRQRLTTPVVEEQQGVPDDRLLQVALRRFAPSFEDVRPPDDQQERLDAELADALLAKVDELAEGRDRRMLVGIGLQVEERWLEGGSLVRLRYELAPGEQEGLVMCEATGAMVTAVSRDREGHLVATTTNCRYCRTGTCGLCVAPTRPCAVCQILVCGRCSSSPEPDYVARCPACVGLRRLSWVERRRFHGLLAPGGRVLVGQDALHGVTLIEASGGWQLMLSEPGQELPSALISSATPRARLVGRIADMA